MAQVFTFLNHHKFGAQIRNSALLPSHQSQEPGVLLVNRTDSTALSVKWQPSAQEKEPNLPTDSSLAVWAFGFNAAGRKESNHSRITVPEHTMELRIPAGHQLTILNSTFMTAQRSPRAIPAKGTSVSAPLEGWFPGLGFQPATGKCCSALP